MTVKLNPDKLGDQIAKILNLHQRRQRASNLPPTRSLTTENVYARTLTFLTGREFDNESALRAWDNIHEHWQRLNKQLGRDVGFFVAALDYLENIHPVGDTKYVFVEENRLNALFEQSTLDGLTLLYNHRTVIMMLEKELEFARRKNSPLTLMMADIDNFKHINDRLGHQHGDKVLARVARILKQDLRAMDVAGRYGGEEFIVVFPDTDTTTARDIAERIRRRIESTFRNDDGITISMGLASYPQVEGKIHRLIHRADQALYQAKQEGKNQLHWYQPA